MNRSALNYRVRLRVTSRRAGFLNKLKLLSLLSLALASACKKVPNETHADAGKPLPGIPREHIESTNNAEKIPPYVGPTGVVEGTITIAGDEAPDLTQTIANIPADCGRAKETYGRLFREGRGRTVADVLVAVTEYKGYVRPKNDHIDVVARDCSWDKRTIALTFGQRIDVRSADNLAYIPQLLGGATGALLVAVPNGEAVPVLPREPGHYELVDAMRLYSKADVFVVRYPTTNVTGIDGHYRIDGVPVGPAKVSALLPAAASVAAKPVTVEANRSTRVDLVLSFDRATYRPVENTPAAAPANSGAAQGSVAK